MSRARQPMVSTSINAPAATAGAPSRGVLSALFAALERFVTPAADIRAAQVDEIREHLTRLKATAMRTTEDWPTSLRLAFFGSVPSLSSIDDAATRQQVFDDALAHAQTAHNKFVIVAGRGSTGRRGGRVELGSTAGRVIDGKLLVDEITDHRRVLEQMAARWIHQRTPAKRMSAELLDYMADADEAVTLDNTLPSSHPYGGVTRLQGLGRAVYAARAADVARAQGQLGMSASAR